jgi:hypothetical protein
MIHLRIKGEISYPRRTKEEIEELRSHVSELRNQGKRPIDIFRTLKEARLCESYICTIDNDLKVLGEKGRVSKAKNQTEIAEKKRKDIKKLSNQGKGPKDISVCLRIPLPTVESHLTALRKADSTYQRHKKTYG